MKFLAENILIEDDLNLEVLYANTEPEHEIIEKWKKTFPEREKCTNVEHYLAKFKCLSSNFGYILVHHIVKKNI